MVPESENKSLDPLMHQVSNSSGTASLSTLPFNLMHTAYEYRRADSESFLWNERASVYHVITALRYL